MLSIQWFKRLRASEGVVVCGRTATNCDTSKDVAAEAQALWADSPSVVLADPDGYQIVDQNGRSICAPSYFLDGRESRSTSYNNEGKSMNVAHILQNKGGTVLTCLADQSLLDVVDILAAKRVGALVVVNAGGEMIGIISERDVVRAISRQGSNVLDRWVSDYMTRDVVVATLSESVDDVLSKINEGRFRHLPILEDGLLIGIVSSGDAVKHRLDLLEIEVSSYQDYIASA